MGKVNKLAIAALICASYGSAAWAVDPFILPTPENNPNASYGMYPDATGALREAILMDGIPVAFKYEEGNDGFWSYSAHILTSIQTVSPNLIPEATFGAYDFSTGTGTIDINLTSVAGGATNTVTLSDGVTELEFQDPDDLFSNQTIQGWQCDWGGSTQTCDFWNESDGSLSNQSYSVPAADVNGTTTVGELLAYLQDLDPTWTIPLIYADYNQTGAGDSLFLSVMVEIIDDVTGTAVDSWYIDAVDDNQLTPSSPTYNFGDISFLGDAAACAANPWDPITGVGCAGVTDSGADYSGSHNLGSGHADFMAFAPTMDLSMFDPNDLWVISFNLGCIPNVIGPLAGDPDGTAGCNTNGGEEFGILGGVGPDIFIPEPGTLVLLGIGLAGLGFRVRMKAARSRA